MKKQNIFELHKSRTTVRDVVDEIESSTKKEVLTKKKRKTRKQFVYKTSILCRI